MAVVVPSHDYNVNMHILWYDENSVLTIHYQVIVAIKSEEIEATDSQARDFLSYCPRSKHRPVYN